jgi:hypothetical protein
MVDTISQNTIAILKSAAKKLKKADKRQFMAEVALEYCGGSPRKTEDVFGWSRHTVELGLNELRTGITCVGNYHLCGRKKAEDENPQLKADILELADKFSQADPSLKSSVAYVSRLSAQGLRDALIEQKDYTSEELPLRRSLSDILNRQGYRLQSVQKTKPQKKHQKQTKSLITSTH